MFATPKVLWSFSNKKIAQGIRYAFPRFISTTISGPVEKYLDVQLQKYVSINKLLETETDHVKLSQYGKESSGLSKIASLTTDRNDILKNIASLLDVEKESNQDPELVEMAKLEREELEANLVGLEKEIMESLTPVDPEDDRNSILEVRAGTGGDEASLFASEIFEMYREFAAKMGWRFEELASSKTDCGGFKEASASITGENVFRHMKFEAGVHRVQRIPFNDTKIQTSAASVVVLPEIDETQVEVRPQDLKIDVYRSGGAGGQSVNRTESAVRFTHLPTGITVCMQDERSQIQNRARAMKILLAKLYELEQKKKQENLSELRSAAQATGDRSDKIRTYNFPQDRVTDHRISFTCNGIDRVLSGTELITMSEALVEAESKRKLTELLESLVE